MEDGSYYNLPPPTKITNMIGKLLNETNKKHTQIYVGVCALVGHMDVEMRFVFNKPRGDLFM